MWHQLFGEAKHSSQLKFCHRVNQIETHERMARSEFGKVKLVSLEIVDFKQLQKGKVEWEFSPNGRFGIISVGELVGKYRFTQKSIKLQNIHGSNWTENVHPLQIDRSTMFQAFQFGFGHDTDANNAEVILTLQRESSNAKETLNFMHSKKVTRRETLTNFGIQIVGVDRNFRVSFLFLSTFCIGSDVLSFRSIFPKTSFRRLIRSNTLSIWLDSRYLHRLKHFWWKAIHKKYSHPAILICGHFWKCICLKSQIEMAIMNKQTRALKNCFCEWKLWTEHWRFSKYFEKNTAWDETTKSKR